VVVPFFGDQPFWGKRVAALGVGPQPIPHKKLDTATLAQAMLQAVNDGEMRRRAEVLGAKICAEDGVAEAVRLVELSR
jgi:UDP:flavonoid glycosyltransferase YjiC (YdhE family)